MILSLTLLGAGIVAYGLAGAQLTTGARDDQGPLRSRSWWTGTALQGAGFILTFFARHDLPLLLVQAGVVGALGVTSAVQHARGVIRLGALDVGAVAGVIAGLALLTVSSEPGTVPATTPTDLVVVAALLLPAATAVVHHWPPLVAGLLSGSAFGVGAVAARLLVAQPDRAVLDLSRWTPLDLGCAVLVVASLGLGQLGLAQGLALGHPVAVLGSMYAASTLLPAVVGYALLGERPRPGGEWLAALGVLVTAAAAGRLVRLEAGGQPAPAS